MSRAVLLLLCWLLVVGVVRAEDAPPSEAKPPDETTAVDYLRDVKPLLARRCASCHGALRQQSGLRVDAAELLRAGGDAGPAIVPGKPDESLLIEAVTGRNGFPLMPKEGGALSAEEIGLLERWIAQGAPAPENEEIAADPREHWAFQPPRRADVPARNAGGAGDGEADARNPVDAFVAAELERQGLAAVGEAPRNVLLRRIHLDLIGLPPSPEELTEFVADDAPDAYEKVVDRLLASPHYGERWGRHWMDVWRYSDWYGYGNELRNSARHIWRWRDWTAESLNAGKPYDRMVVEMLAADEVSPLDRDALRATGYLARSYFKFNRDTWLDDTIEHTGKAFLGLTINCARCHDHMYDPISQREYYQFRAVFEPYQVRTDRLPGQADVMQDGLPRVYDAALDAPTFLYERGNDKHPDKDNPLPPGVPETVAADVAFNVQPVSLPVEAWYPGYAEFVQQEELAAARAAVTAREAEFAKATAARDKASRQWDALSARLNGPVVAPRPGEGVALANNVEFDAGPTAEAAQVERNDAEAGVAVAEGALAAARATLESVEARIAADRARFGNPTAADAEERSLTAARLGVGAALRQAETEVAAAELDVERAKRKTSKDGAPDTKAAAQAQTRLDAARKRLDEIRQTADKPADGYKPFSDKFPQTSSGRRLALARWIVDERNPLTARVAVNHVWLRHYGEPLVASVFDFGRNGSPPTHPELLDWLAVELAGQEATDQPAWSLKRLHRLLVTSAAYRRDSTAAADHPGWTSDPENRWLWRMNARRMEAEIVRDSVLAVGGRLDRRMGGPELGEDQAQTVARRSIYFRHAPEKHAQFLAMFDSASTHECYRRVETVVPQQALAMANSRLTREQSRRLARQLSSEIGGAGDAGFVRASFERILCRPPTLDEVERCVQFIAEQTARLAEGREESSSAEAKDTSVAPAADPRARAHESLVHVLLNHNEFITIR